MRTTSSVEAVNSTIQRDFPANTNIFKFTESLKMFESEKSSELHNLSLEKNLDRKLQRRRAKDRNREAKIKACTEALKDGTISVLEFLEAMATREFIPEAGMNI